MALIVHDIINQIGKGSVQAIVQRDGNFVVSKKNEEIQWSTNTTGNWNASLILEDDGNLILFSSTNEQLWSTNTSSNGRFNKFFSLMGFDL